MMEAGDVGGRLTPGVFSQIRRRFCQDWLQFPTLSEEIARFLDEAGILAGGPRPRTSDPSRKRPRPAGRG